MKAWKSIWLGVAASLGVYSTAWAQAPAVPAAPTAGLGGLQQPGDSPDGLAAQIKKDEADAKARRAAVRYLGTVDCNIWPEAIEVLIKSLRKDHNEFVRFEAALALQSGCRCKEVIVALTNCVAGPAAPPDGFPKESSPRVRAAAANALAHCVMVQQPELPETAPQPRQVEKTQAPVKPEEYYRKVAQIPRKEIVAKAREVLQKNPEAATTSIKAGVVGTPSTGAVVAEKREPFFSNLTRTLTGRQDGVAFVRVPGSSQNITYEPMRAFSGSGFVRTPPLPSQAPTRGWVVLDDALPAAQRPQGQR